MRYHFILFIIISLTLVHCKTSQQSSSHTNTNENSTEVANDTIRIHNPESEYDIIIIEPGFADWLVTQQPKENFGQTYLEIRNKLFVANWNRKTLHPTKYGNENLYQQEINYFPNVDYGLEVNYKLFMYFNFFQEKYNQDLLN